MVVCSIINHMWFNNKSCIDHINLSYTIETFYFFQDCIVYCICLFQYKNSVMNNLIDLQNNTYLHTRHILNQIGYRKREIPHILVCLIVCWRFPLTKEYIDNLKVRSNCVKRPYNDIIKHTYVNMMIRQSKKKMHLELFSPEPPKLIWFN